MAGIGDEIARVIYCPFVHKAVNHYMRCMDMKNNIHELLVTTPTMTESENKKLHPTDIGTFPSSVLVYVDCIENGVYCGVFQNVFDRKNIVFCGLDELLLKINNYMDEIKCPQAFMRQRSWKVYKAPKKPEPDKPREWTKQVEHKFGLPDPKAINARRGRIASFCISVLSRQGASWQGRIIWLPVWGHSQTIYFRSALELLGLMNEALSFKGSCKSEA